TYPLLTNGECRTFSGSEVVPADLCSLTDTLTARGTNLCGLGLVATATTNCPILTTPRLTLTKSCPPTPPAPGGTLNWSGTVTNVGNVAVTNIVIVNNQPAPNTPVTTIARLEPGQGTTFSGSYTIPVSCPQICSISDTITASGRDVCGNLASKNITAICPFASQPAIKVYKQVVCYSNLCEPFSADLTAQHSATGVRVDPNNCPAFCYRITVTNQGNVCLTNVTVTDSSTPGPNLNLSCFPPG